MFIYSIEAMPGQKAKFDGDTSVKYNVRRKYTSTTSDKKNLSDVIRTDLEYSEATALVEIFNNKERESRAIKQVEARASH